MAWNLRTCLGCLLVLAGAGYLIEFVIAYSSSSSSPVGYASTTSQDAIWAPLLLFGVLAAIGGGLIYWGWNADKPKPTIPFVGAGGPDPGLMYLHSSFVQLGEAYANLARAQARRGDVSRELKICRQFFRSAEKISQMAPIVLSSPDYATAVPPRRENPLRHIGGTPDPRRAYQGSVAALRIALRLSSVSGDPTATAADTARLAAAEAEAAGAGALIIP